MRLLIVGQGSQHSGYARVLRTLAPLLAQEIEVCYFTLRAPEAPGAAGVTYIAPKLRSDPFGLEELPAVLADVRPNMVLACHDPQVLATQTEVFRTHGDARIVLYLPLEWRWLEPAMLRGLAAADLLVCYTETARQWVLSQAGPGAPVAAAPIPHGVDRALFGPVDAAGTLDVAVERSAARAAARRLLGLSERETVILNANRDTPRKRLEATLRAFALVADEVPDARLVLTHGQQLRDLTLRRPLRDRVLIPDEPPGSDRILNWYYNCADVGLNTCTAEGWGLVAFEHAAAGAAQVMPAHPALREIWGPAAGFAPYEPSDVDGYGLVEPADVAAALLPLCGDRGRADGMGQLARARAASAEFDWDRIARQWITVLREAEAGCPRVATPDPAMIR